MAEGRPGPVVALEVSELIELGLVPPEVPFTVPLPLALPPDELPLVCATATDAPSTSVINVSAAVFIACLFFGLECPPSGH